MALDDVEEKTILTSSGSQSGLVGSTLDGRLKILALIGEGGMSSVYKARHTIANKIYAVKTLHRHLADESALKRFRQEFVAVGALEHPNIIRVHNLGIEEGLAFLMLDYLEGRSLSDVIKSDGPLELGRALHIFLQIVDALDHAHKKGIVHRDLKPSNVMLINQDGDDDFVKILDFGIAKVATGQTPDFQLTRTGDVVGSPSYMSPEQCQGQSLDARSDIYSMGCLMFETVVGSTPYQGKTYFEIIDKHLNEPVPEPSKLRPGAKLNLLEPIIFKAMAKDVALRYQCMEDMRADLLKVAEHKGLVGILTTSFRASKSKVQNLTQKKKRVTIQSMLGLAVSMLLLGVAVVFSIETMNLISKEERRVAPKIATSSLAYRPPERPFTPPELQRIRENLAEKSQVLSKAKLLENYQAYADSLHRHQNYEDAARYYQKVLSGVKNDPLVEVERKAALMRNLADCQLKLGDFDGAEKNYSQGLKIVEGALSDTDSWVLMVKTKLGRVELARGNYEKAHEMLSRVNKTIDPTSQHFLRQEISPLLGHVLCDLADAKAGIKRYADAGSIYGTLAASFGREDKNSPGYAICLLREAQMEALEGTPTAEGRFDYALYWMERVFGVEDPRFIDALAEYQQLLLQRRNYFGALNAKKRWQDLVAKYQKTQT